MGKLRILSIDGGGLRGIVPLMIIKHIEEKTGRQIHELFDVIAGTSTGGLLTCALLVPDKESVISDSRLFDIDTIEKIYSERGADIFPPTKNMLQNIYYWFYSKFFPRYKAKNIERVLQEYLEGYYVLDCLRPVFITTYDIHRLQPVYFTTREAIEDGKNALLTDVCRATSAAPTYFSTHNMFFGKNHLFCIDGGIFMNNPSLGVMIEVLNNPDYKYYDITSGLSLENIHILSLGTGFSNKTYNGEKSKKWGEVQWAKPAINISLNSVSGIIDDHLRTMFLAIQCSNNYLRQDIFIEEKYSEMSDSNKETRDYLKTKVDQQIINDQSNQSRLDDFLEEILS